VAGVTPARREYFFREEPGGYRVVKSLREMVLFAGHNVLQDPPFARLDLVSCRNLFIYLEEEAQQRALETFHFALNPHGVLFLGAAESVGDSGLFTSAAPATIACSVAVRFRRACCRARRRPTCFRCVRPAQR
jgi:two-component system, chemotaxis family, CheB/CheR fusion protein